MQYIVFNILRDIVHKVLFIYCKKCFKFALVDI